MNPLNRSKFFLITGPISANGAAYTTNEIDTVDATLGKAAYLDVIILTGLLGADMGVLKLQASDTSGSGFADVTGTDIVAAYTNAGGDNQIGRITVDLRNPDSKRYYDASITAGAGATLMGAVAVLSFNNVQPTTATLRGLLAEAFV